MPQAIPVGFLVGGYAALNLAARPASAISPEALALRKVATAVVKNVQTSHSLFGSKNVAISQIWSLANECAQAGWDGGDACPLDRIAAAAAEDFIRALPEGFPMPECAPEPDGCISLDWIQSRHRLFSLSIGSSDRLAYAWLDGADRGHGVARFDRVSIPMRVLTGIQSILGQANAPVGIA